MRKPRLTYANVVSTIALGLALTGGTAIAANTIGSGDIRTGAVRSVDLKNNDVRSVDIKNGQIRPGDLAKQTKLTVVRVGKQISVAPGERKARKRQLSSPVGRRSRERLENGAMALRPNGLDESGRRDL